MKYIDDSVIDIYAIVNEIHDSLGYPPFQPNNTTRTGVGIGGLVEDMIAALSLDDMKALFYKKMETKEHYKALVTVIQTPEFTVSNLCVYVTYVIGMCIFVCELL